MKNIINSIVKFVKNFFETIGMGLYYLCLIISKGFFFYFYFLFTIIGFVFRFKFIEKIKNCFKDFQKTPVPFLTVTVLCLFGVFFYVYLYSGNNKMVHVPENITDIVVPKTNPEEEQPTNEGEDEEYVDDNLYRKYGSTKFENINIGNLKKEHSDIVAWIIVDGTNINYPIVQSGDNEYYLYHDINGVSKISGWTFMDYRNADDMSDKNTIFYGHNLLNRTAFGSIANIFTDDWFYSSSHKIIILTAYGNYVYQIFSNYYIDPEVYYLQNNFSSDSSYQEFLDTLKGRSIYDYGIDLSSSDKIITLSTCTEDNSGRKVVHAKLITG